MTSVISQVAALVRRDLIIELSYHFQLGLRVFGILMTVLTFFFLGRLVGDSDALAEYRGGYFEFALVGLLMMGFAQACVSALTRSVESAQADGTFEILLSTSTRLPTLMLGSLVVPVLFAAATGAGYLVLGWLLVGFAASLGALLIAGLVLLLTLGTFAAVGIFAAATIILTKRGDPFSTVVLSVSFLLAGTVYPVAVLPEWLQVASRLVPAFYGLNGAREALLAGGGLAEVGHELLVLVAFNAVLLPVSLVAMNRAVHIARITGTLGNR